MLLIITILFGIGRIFSFLIPAGLALNSFKAFAHIWVGGLFGAYFVKRDEHYLELAVGISVLELIMFLIGILI